MKRLLPLVLLAACAVPAERPGQQAGAVDAAPCPQRTGLGVPAEPTADTLGRLVPPTPPAAALVCRYAPLATGEDESALVGQAAVAQGLDGVPEDLLLPGRQGGTPAASCGGAPGPVTPLLLRLSYPDGVVWVAATLEADPCRGATNGVFASAEDVGDVLAASAAAGRWTVPPLPDAGQRCVPGRTGRLGQETALLPAGVQDLVLCRVGGDGVTRRTATARERAVVADVLDEPVAVLAPRACDGGGEQHELAATYASGPAVLVRYAPACDPDVDNGSLRADLEPAARARLEAVLEGGR